MDQNRIANTAAVADMAPTISESTAQMNERRAERSDALAYSSSDDSRCWKPASSSRECSSYSDTKAPERQGGEDKLQSVAFALLGISILLLLSGLAAIPFSRTIGALILCSASWFAVVASLVNTVAAWRNWQEVKRQTAHARAELQTMRSWVPRQRREEEL